MPNPSTTDLNGDFVTSVGVKQRKIATETAITASTTIDAKSVKSVGVTTVVCSSVLYVTNSITNNVSVIDTNTNMVVDTITGFSNPDGIVVNSKTNLVYVYNFVLAQDDALSIIDATTNVIVNTVTDGRGVGQFGIAINESENLLYLASNDDISSYLIILDTISNQIIGTTTVPPDATGVAVDIQRNLIYVTSDTSGIVSVIDGDIGFVVTATVNVGGSPQGISVNELENKIYVATGGPNNLVSVINGNSYVVNATITVGDNPVGIAFNEENNQIYVSNIVSSNISVIDGGLDIVTFTITGGEQPTVITIDEDSNIVYVINQATNNISVIDGNSNELITTITVGILPQGITLFTPLC
ncbi:beta-propeller fold lactonase family protein [Bacillus carboniphilus]|uniref:Beta-propeller fold lactonase family protein n=1 Tax=Bacillus carboniphilus TaxID=86663 RepID=A0ABY9JSU6_9BACI|nr:beta-propeller fold lactonase family protein [Bacillus carboniphilus]WLR42471.1 beta-propeller fold lactonase family protein [Bacillus carboniphilus]